MEKISLADFGEATDGVLEEVLSSVVVMFSPF
jgi:hypothetical protein